MFPEQYGGTGGDFMDLAVLLEETGRALLPGPLASTVVLGGLTVLDAGSDAQKQEILPGICSGRILMTLALTEPSATLEPAGVETTATADDGGYRLNGTKLFVPDAHAATTYCWWWPAPRRRPVRPQMTMRSRASPSFWWTPDSPGVNINQLNSIASDRLCEVTLDRRAKSPPVQLSERWTRAGPLSGGRCSGA